MLLRNIREISNQIEGRVALGELDRKEGEELVRQHVKRLVANLRPDEVPKNQAWMFGDAFRMAGDWETAKKLYTTAVENAKTNDRVVNDSLRLARVQAHLGDVETSISTCRSTFGVPPKDKAPILMAVLYEVVPEAKGKGHDPELAKLLEGAIAQHEATIVDLQSRAGKDFINARPLHVHAAWLQVARLYQASGMVEESRRAADAEDKAARKTSRI